MDIRPFEVAAPHYVKKIEFAFEQFFFKISLTLEQPSEYILLNFNEYMSRKVEKEE
jgi:hypothetical protein